MRSRTHPLQVIAIIFFFIRKLSLEKKKMKIYIPFCACAVVVSLEKDTLRRGIEVCNVFVYPHQTWHTCNGVYSSLFHAKESGGHSKARETRDAQFLQKFTRFALISVTPTRPRVCKCPPPPASVTCQSVAILMNRRHCSQCMCLCLLNAIPPFTHRVCALLPL